jgi:hypothetical protein
VRCSSWRRWPRAPRNGKEVRRVFVLRSAELRPPEIPPQELRSPILPISPIASRSRAASKRSRRAPERETRHTIQTRQLISALSSRTPNVRTSSPLGPEVPPSPRIRRAEHSGSRRLKASFQSSPERRLRFPVRFGLRRRLRHLERTATRRYRSSSFRRSRNPAADAIPAAMYRRVSPASGKSAAAALCGKTDPA